MPATASSMESSPLLLPLPDDLLPDHRPGRRCPVYPGGGVGAE